MVTNRTKDPGRQGATLQSQPPAASKLFTPAQNTSAEPHDTQLCQSAQLDESTIDLHNDALRDLHNASLHETVVLVGARWGNEIDYLRAGQFVRLGLLEQMDVRTFRITDAGRTYLKAHPWERESGGLYAKHAVGADPEYRYKWAVSQLAYLLISKATGRCYACMGVGFHDGDGDRGHEYGHRTRFGEDAQCEVCDGSGKAPNTYEYRDWLASIRKNLDVTITAHQHADKAVGS